MIGSLFILNDKGSVLFEKHYRRVSSRACCDDFWKMIERKAGQQVRSHVAHVLTRAADLFFDTRSCRRSFKKALSRTHPFLLIFLSLFTAHHFFDCHCPPPHPPTSSSNSYVHVHHRGIFLLAVIERDISPLLVIEFLRKLFAILLECAPPPPLCPFVPVVVYCFLR